MISSIPAPIPIDARLARIHETIRAELLGVDRVALAVYDRKTDLLKTFVNSTEGGSPLEHYQARLADVPSLVELAERGGVRVLGDIAAEGFPDTTHTRAVLTRFCSSYTQPIFEEGKLRGFLFFDAREKDYFTEPVVQRLRVYADLVALLFISSLFPVRMLASAVRVASQVTHTRDPETGAHLERMARYARLVARGLAERGQLSDSFVEYLFLFAPLHDIGKIGVPDEVLLKRGRLTDEEFVVMQTHVAKGTEMIDRVLENAGVNGLPYVEVLKNVVSCHHESWDGSGYPAGRAGTDIPVEARIVTVADVYDALTSERPYKHAWTSEEAVTYLKREAGKRFDPTCVQLLVDRIDEVEAIRARFRDAPALALREGYSKDL